MKKLYLKTRAAWRKWLKKNYRTAKEIWLMTPHKSSGKPGVLYNDAVEVALCFGWIDSTVRNINPDFSAQRYSPRNPHTAYSQANIERLKLLSKQGQLAPDVKKSTISVIKKIFTFPRDIMDAIREDETAWKNFAKFPAAYKRLRVAFVEGARKRPAMFRTRLKYLTKMSHAGKMFGYGGIDKYYKK